ncbi:MAG: hypothetical protein ACD_22C00234G0002 [uncultured bacterium]|nr:MAG: hypothetical protein ACD_22C00234G0002 [uncultured bacterium]
MELLETNYNQKIKELIEGAKHIAIIPSKVAGVNAFCAGVGLYHMLIEKEKAVSFIYPGKTPDGCVDLIKKEEITSNVSERELYITIDYSNTPAANVHYSTDNDILTLKLSPVEKDFDLSKVKATLGGFDFDVVITIGILDFDDFGHVYNSLNSEIRMAKILNIDHTSKNAKFGNLNVVDTSSDTLSLIVYKNAMEWGLSHNVKSAKALLSGITYNEQKVDKS